MCYYIPDVLEIRSFTMFGGISVKQYDVVIQLGSQVKYFPPEYDHQTGREEFKSGTLDGWDLAPHTMMRTEASAYTALTGMTKKLVIVGGSNFNVRYDDQLVFNDQHPIQKKPVFTFEAFANSDYTRKSEAAVIKDFLVRVYHVKASSVFAETLSSTTEENAKFVQIILQRRPMFTGNERLAILTLLYHMEDKINPETGERKLGALNIFRETGLAVDPLFAENVLASNDVSQIKKICDYYSTPKLGKQYPIDRIRQLLTEGKSLAEMMV